MINVLFVKRLVDPKSMDDPNKPYENVVVIKEFYMPAAPTLGLCVMLAEDLTFYISNVIYRPFCIFGSLTEYVVISSEVCCESGDLLQRYIDMKWERISNEDNRLKGILV